MCARAHMLVQNFSAFLQQPLALKGRRDLQPIELPAIKVLCRFAVTPASP